MSFWFEYDEDGERQTFSFDGDNVSIGRDQSQDFVLDHPTVSRQHALVIDDGNGQFRLVVLSRGGLTAVDGERIEGESELYDGTQVHFGKLAFQFRSEEAPSKPADSGGASMQASSSPGGQHSQRGGTAGGPGPSGGDDDSGGQMRASNTVNSSERAGIASWDEIAESAKEEGRTGGEDQSESTKTSGSFEDDDFDPLESARDGADEEQTNPVILIVGVLGIVGLLGYTYWPRGGPGGGGGNNPLEKKDPQALVKVDCLSEEKCLKEARASYQVGVEYLEKQDSGVANLFKGYKRLLESQAYLKKAEVGSRPEEFSDLQARIDKTDEKLKGIFRNYKVKYRSAQKNSQPREMAAALKTIQRYFPDKRAPEYEWANKRILRMKEKGNYPSNF